RNPTLSLILKSDGRSHWMELYHRHSSAPGRVWKLDVQKGEWMDWVFRINWSESYTDGSFEVWRDGQHVLETQRSRTIVPGNASTHFKVGIYRGHHIQQEFSVLYDNVFIS